MPSELVPTEHEGARFDLVLARVAGISRATGREMIDAGEATYNGAVCAPRTKVAAGGVIEFPEIPEFVFEPDPDVEFETLYEDEHLAVIDKPAGLVVHATSNKKMTTLAGGLVHRWPEMLNVGHPGRWGLVHRLDRDTSGALLVAKTPPALDQLQDQMRAREIKRTYRALATGKFAVPTGTIDAPLSRDRRNPTRRAVDPYGKPARTHYRLLEEWSDPELSLLEVRLETGRTHQIRVHFAAIDHHIVADRTYRTVETLKLGLHRTWLHAYTLEFVHPATGEEITATAPLPPDLVETLEVLRGHTEDPDTI